MNNKLIPLALLWFICSMNVFSLMTLKCQTPSTKNAQFFDPKYKITKNSIVQNDTGYVKFLSAYPVHILEKNGDTVFLELKNFGEEIVNENTLLAKVEKKNERVYFLVSESDNALLYTDFDFSPLVIPLKIRPAIGDNPLQFLGDVAIGPYFGYQFGKRSFDFSATPSQTTLTACAFGSPTMINLNSSNQTNSPTNGNSVLGLSTGLGLLFDINSLQFGLTTGWDWISGEVSETWIYQGKVWTSFSFAYNLSNQ